MESIFNKTEIRRRCEEFFSVYEVANDRDLDMCLAKIIHTRNVASNCTHIAISMGLDSYDTDLAWIIGELHDFARFGQIMVTHTFRDTPVYNHAHNGVRLLFDHELIDDIIPNYDEVSPEDRLVIKKAIYHHSDLALPDDLTVRERLFCDIIRDADQIDIFRTIVESGWVTIYGKTKEEILASDISDPMSDAIFEHRLAEYAKRTTPADYHIAHIALCFGLRSQAAIQTVVEMGYLQQMLNITFSKPEVQELYAKIRDEVEHYLGVTGGDGANGVENIMARTTNALRQYVSP